MLHPCCVSAAYSRHGFMADGGNSASSPGWSGHRWRKFRPTANGSCATSKSQRTYVHAGQGNACWPSTHDGAMDVPVMRKAQLAEQEVVPRLRSSQGQTKAGKREQSSDCQGSTCTTPINLACQAGPMGQGRCQDRTGLARLSTCRGGQQQRSSDHQCEQGTRGISFRWRRYLCGAHHRATPRGTQQSGAGNQQSSTVEPTRGVHRPAGEAQAGPACYDCFSPSTWQTARQGLACGEKGEGTQRQLGTSDRDLGSAARPTAERAGGCPLQGRTGQGGCGRRPENGSRRRRARGSGWSSHPSWQRPTASPEHYGRIGALPGYRSDQPHSGRIMVASSAGHSAQGGGHRRGGSRAYGTGRHGRTAHLQRQKSTSGPGPGSQAASHFSHRKAQPVSKSCRTCGAGRHDTCDPCSGRPSWPHATRCGGRNSCASKHCVTERVGSATLTSGESDLGAALSGVHAAGPAYLCGGQRRVMPQQRAMRRKTRKGLLLGFLAQQYTYRWCWWVCQLLSLVSGDVCPREWPHLSAPGGGNDHHLSPLCAPNGKPWFPPQAYPAPGWVAVSAWHVSVSLTACVGGPCLAAVLPPRPRVKDFSGPGIVHEPFLVMEAKTSPAPCTSGLSLSRICSQASAAPMSLVLPCMCWSQAGTQHYQPPPITPGSATSALGAAGAILLVFCVLVAMY